MKTCFKCSRILPLDEFYAHPMMADGHLGKCKECTKADTRANYRAHWQQYREYDRQRNQKAERRALKRDYLRRESLDSKTAHAAVGNAIRNGRLKKNPCEVCGDVRVEGHHDDYGKPLEVRWLCFRHHREVAHGQRVGIEGNDWRPF